MRFKRFGNKFILRIDKGEEIVETLKRFCKENSIKLASITGIGATDKAIIGILDLSTKKYSSKEFKGDYEITNLSGNITTMNNEPYIHLHITLGDSKQRAFGGHLNSAVVSATFEAVVNIIEGAAEREFSKELGINLIRL